MSYEELQNSCSETTSTQHTKSPEPCGLAGRGFTFYVKKSGNYEFQKIFGMCHVWRDDEKIAQCSENGGWFNGTWIDIDDGD